ncbi:MAG: hypothetical protein R3281_00095 [Balneolaceae bacterium]|nr:hypothetical protein [Balneolaceae bacterium]
MFAKRAVHISNYTESYFWRMIGQYDYPGIGYNIGPGILTLIKQYPPELVEAACSHVAGGFRIITYILTNNFDQAEQRNCRRKTTFRIMAIFVESTSTIKPNYYMMNPNNILEKMHTMRLKAIAELYQHSLSNNTFGNLTLKLVVTTRIDAE